MATIDADGGRHLKRPMARVRQIGLFSREIAEHLSEAGVELLLSVSARLSEGQLAPSGRYFGSTMLTIDLSALSAQVKDSCDAVTAARVANLLTRSPSAQEQIASIAASEAQRISGQPVALPELDVRYRTQGARVFVDIDVEGQAERQAATR